MRRNKARVQYGNDTVCVELETHFSDSKTEVPNPDSTNWYCCKYNQYLESGSACRHFGKFGKCPLGK